MLVFKNRKTPQTCNNGRLNNQYAFHPLLMNDLHRFWGSDEPSEMPKVNITEDEQSYSIHLAAPGLKKEDFKIHVERDLLIVSSGIQNSSEDNQSAEKQPKFLRKEFSYNGFKRSFKMPENTDVAGIKASYTDGILTVVLPKKESAKEGDTKTITIS